MKLKTPTNTNSDAPQYKNGTENFCVGNSKSFESYKEMCEVPHGKAQPCGKDTVGKIYRILKKFFVILRGLKKYLDKYVNQTINAINNLQSEIQATISEIAGVLKTLVHRAREWVLKKVKRGIEDLMDIATTPQTTEPKKALLSRIIDEIFCKFDQIIAGLFNLVGDFLNGLISKVINIPFCAAESFINALLSKLLNDIDNALKPLFDQINKVLAPISKVMGSVFQVIDFILGFEGFLCEKPECNDELKSFEAGPWGRPQNTNTDNWSNFSFSSTIGKSAGGLMNDFFGAGKNGNYTSPGGCYSGDFNCGINVEFFGGGGSGAAGAAVVNKIGQIVGVSLFYGGSQYESTPFVSFVDPGGCGSRASGHPILNNRGEVEDIVIDNPGIGYPNNYPFSPVIRDFTARPTSVEADKSILFSWQTENSTNVSLSSREYLLTGYSKLPVNGNQSVNVSSASLSFPAGKSSTIVRYTLTAVRDVSGWQRQQITKYLDVEVFLPGFLSASPLSQSTTSSLTPSILNFDATPTITTVGRVVRFNWQTLDTTFVKLGLVTGPASVTSIYDNLIANGSASVVLPNNLVFPKDGSNIINTYVLTATNTKAPNTDVKYVSVEIVSPKSSLSNWTTTPSKTSIRSRTGTRNITGTTNNNLGTTNIENNSGSLEDFGINGVYISPDGDDTNIPGGGSGGLPGNSNTGGGDTADNNITKFLSSGTQSSGGAGIDPAGNSTSTSSGTLTDDTASLPGGGGGTGTESGGGTGTGGGGGGGTGTGGGGGGTGTESGGGTGTGGGGGGTGTESGGGAGIGGGGGAGTGGGGGGTGTESGGGAGIGGGGVDVTNDVISEIHDVEIVDTGTGYTPEDKVEIVGGNNGAELSIQTSPTGQIFDIKVISGGHGFVTIPEIRINTIDGLGAKFKTILRFTSASKFTQRELNRIGTDKLLRVVDCVLR